MSSPRLKITNIAKAQNQAHAIYALGTVLVMAMALCSSSVQASESGQLADPLANETNQPLATQIQGVTRPVYDAKLSFASQGTIFTLPVKAGAQVKKGELLMALDTRAEESRLAAITAEIESPLKLQSLQTRLDQSQLDMQRYQSAYEHKAATAMETQHSQLNVTLSKLAKKEEQFRVTQLRLAHEELAAQIDRMRLYSPCDCVVEDVMVELGMAVDRSLPALRLVDTQRLRIDINLPIEQALQFKAGESLWIRYAPQAQPVKATIVNISRLAVLSNHSLGLRLEAPNPQHYPAGMQATVALAKAGDTPPASWQ